MPEIAPGNTLPRSPLAQVGMEYALDGERFIARNVLPPFGVDIKSSTRLVWSPAAGLGLVNSARGRDGKPNRVTREQLEERVYACQSRYLEYAVDLDEALELGADFDIDSHSDAAGFLMKYLLRGMEKRVSDLVFNTTTFSGARTEAGPKINNDPAADVEGMVKTAHDKIQSRIGVSPNVAVMTFTTLLALGRNTQMRERLIAAVGAAAATVESMGRIIPNVQALASLWGVERIEVGETHFADQPRGGPAPPALQKVWDNDFLLFARVNNTRSLRAGPQIGRTFFWNPRSGPDGEPFINPPYNENLVLDVIQGLHTTDEQVFTPDAGHLFTGINAP